MGRALENGAEEAERKINLGKIKMAGRLGTSASTW